MCSPGRGCGSFDTSASAGRHFVKRALGRLLSAAREPAPTHSGFGHEHEPSSGPDQADSGHNGRKVCMPREITSATSLENLKKETKRWLRALRAGDAGARAGSTARIRRRRPNRCCATCSTRSRASTARQLDRAEGGDRQPRRTCRPAGRTAAARHGGVRRARAGFRARLRARRSRAGPAQPPLRTRLHLRRPVGGDLAPRLCLPPAIVPGAGQLPAARRGPADSRAGYGVRQLGRAAVRGPHRRASVACLLDRREREPHRPPAAPSPTASGTG